MILVGRPGSGKTTFLVNLLSRGRYNNERRGLKKMFHNIVVCSPSIASLKNNIFKNLDDTKLFEDFNLEFIEFVKELTEIEADKGFSTLVICDDVGAALRKNPMVEKGYLHLSRLQGFRTTLISFKLHRLILFDERDNELARGSAYQTEQELQKMVSNKFDPPPLCESHLMAKRWKDSATGRPSGFG